MATNLKAKPVRIHVRWMIRRDMPDVVAVERAAAEPGAATWGEDEFLTALRRRNCVGMIACTGRDQDIVGFMVYELQPDHLVVLKFVPHPDWAERGVEAALGDKLRQKLESHRRDYLIFATPAGPYRPEASPEWATTDVRFLCGGDLTPDLAVLADALQEAGCEDETLLATFRQNSRVAREIYQALRPVLTGGTGCGLEIGE